MCNEMAFIHTRRSETDRQTRRRRDRARERERERERVSERELLNHMAKYDY